ncbi:hypothetical protein Nepgr_021764 [Nepenthes gracilis]|uniref:Large ribosomal subunit protein bL28c n=1 Tax=Nepenthes gracilis TaxID=150966 RepID=A0AAD3SXD1_NEPGR|nr:hypothetical protein Nepgr_021764 [Nepenthes gracilis]
MSRQHRDRVSSSHRHHNFISYVLRDFNSADCQDNRRSVVGFIVFSGESLVSWKSKKHYAVSRSSAEEECRFMTLVFYNEDSNSEEKAMAASGLFLSKATSLCFRRPQYPNSESLKPQAVSSELGFIASRLSGIKILHCNEAFTNPVAAPFRHSLQPVARRICPFTGKKSNRANKISFSNHKTKKLQFVNLQYKKIWWEAGKRYVKLRLSTKALKTIEKNGLDAVAKKAGIDLRKE